MHRHAASLHVYVNLFMRSIPLLRYILNLFESRIKEILTLIPISSLKRDANNMKYIRHVNIRMSTISEILKLRKEYYTV